MKPRAISSAFALFFLFLGLGCGGSSGSSGSSTPASPSGAMNVRLVDSPTSEFREIDLDIQKVEIHQSSSMEDSGWITLGTPNKVVNLLTLQGGVVETLASGASLAPGTYQQLRLVLGTRNSVMLADGTTGGLRIPSGLQTGIKIPGSFTVAAGTTSDVFIDFDAARSIHIHDAGQDRTFILRPVVQGFDKAVTGSISGTFTASGGLPLAGVEVFAERINGSGEPSILRTVRTSLTGSYSLDLLPLGGSYFVVSLPVAGSAVYQAKASDEVALSTTQPTRVYDAVFAPALATGSATGTINPPGTSSQSDTLLIMEAFPGAGGGQRWLVVATRGLIEATPETYTTPPLPIGLYNLVVERSTLNADGTTLIVRSPTGASVQVSAGIASIMNINF